MSSKKRSFQRNAPSKSPYPIIVVSCEGKTEEVYINELIKYFNLKNIQILPTDTKTSALDVVKKACNKKHQNEKEKAARKGDCFFSVFDGDQDIKEAKLHAEENNVQTIISSPCFEYWVLLHYKKTDRPYENCEKVFNDVKKFDQQYKKTDSSFHSNIINKKLDEAEANAKSISKDSLSSTNMHTLVAHLRKMSKES